MENELAMATLWARCMENELAMATLWARCMENELAMATLWARCMENELAMATLWARCMENELAMATLWARCMENELAMATLWARCMENELTMATLWARCMENELAKATLWARCMENELAMATLRVRRECNDSSYTVTVPVRTKLLEIRHTRPFQVHCALRNSHTDVTKHRAVPPNANKKLPSEVLGKTDRQNQNPELTCLVKMNSPPSWPPHDPSRGQGFSLWLCSLKAVDGLKCEHWPQPRGMKDGEVRWDGHGKRLPTFPVQELQVSPGNSDPLHTLFYIHRSSSGGGNKDLPQTHSIHKQLACSIFRICPKAVFRRSAKMGSRAQATA
ncbi:hypothetical protein TREES_T100009651 [Tupaia chinensis]|uniref:Uncharacterized protein n=1 Tax=Tupaia chinensis TaxID=246437 RepID=L9LCR1_TUPCH|nr:hypothetical protein TREES_T100009651 [Tupaia chinensis]